MLVLGHEAICTELSKLGIASVGGDTPQEKLTFDQLIYELELDANIRGVVVGTDPHFSWSRISVGSLYNQ